jgi:TRAP transporter TAXI family solute receptor
MPPRRLRAKFAVFVWVSILCVCVAALMLTYTMFVEPPPPHKIVIASGGQSGAYYRFAKKYAEELARSGLQVDVRETAGSIENLRLLGEADSGVTIAIVQSGVASAEQLKKFAALGSLYREPLWVFYRGDKECNRLSEFAGKRIGVGPPGSGTNAIAMQLLAVNGIGADSGPKDGVPTVLRSETIADAASALQKGSLDAAFFVAAFEADYIQKLLMDSSVKLMNFEQHEAYRRRFRFFAPVTVPAGLVNLGQNLPARDVSLLAPTAMLVARKDLHPALVPLLLTTATAIHGSGNELCNPGEFPSESFCDFPVSDDAKRFYKSGPPMLQRMLPFWVASMVDRAKVMLIPLIMLMMPLVRAAPPLMRWRTRRKIYMWYSDLRDIDKKLANGLSGAALEAELARLKKIEHQVAHVDVPLSYMEEFYHLRAHLGMLQEHLTELRTRDDLR